MKRFVSTILLSGALLSASAQNYLVSPEGVIYENGMPTVVTPASTIVVDLVVESEEVIAGPYARYAQKYLAMQAPLISRKSYKVVSGNIALAADGQLVGSTELAQKEKLTNIDSKTTSYTKVPVDRNSAVVLSAEDAAASAAASIFKIRRQRMELLTGEVGESVYGAGLTSALEYFAEMERELTEMFLGRQIIERKSHRYVVSPRKNTNQYVVSRFSEQRGILPDTDFTGDPIYVQMIPQDSVQTTHLAASPKNDKVQNVRIAARTECVLFNNTEMLDRAYLPIFEFGESVRIALPRK